MAGLLRRPRPGAAAEGGEAHGGLRRADAVFGLPLLADAAGDGAAALGADGTADAEDDVLLIPLCGTLRGGHRGRTHGAGRTVLAGEPAGHQIV